MWEITYIEYKQLVFKAGLYPISIISEICFVVGLLNQFMHKSRDIHRKTVRILAYINSSSGKGLFYKKYGHFYILVYSDLRYVGDKGDRKSTSGYITIYWGQSNGMEE